MWTTTSTTCRPGAAFSAALVDRYDNLLVRTSGLSGDEAYLVVRYEYTPGFEKLDQSPSAVKPITGSTTMCGSA